jgi:hypothetical protein
MTFRPAYLDSSALLKLVLPERESDELARALDAWPDRVSSAIAAVECRRALRRVGAAPGVHRRADAVLQTVTLVRVDEPVLRVAGEIGPGDVRTLDAVHLATALSTGDDPEAFITYDDRLAQAGRAAGLVVLQPGR